MLMTDMLVLKELQLSFGGQQVLNNVSLTVGEAETVALIGPNGAGKTSIFNCINRSYVPSSGEIWFEGREVLLERAHKLAPLGISRTFQNIELVASATVKDNVLVGAHWRSEGSWLEAMLDLGRSRRFEKSIRAELELALASVGLAGTEDRITGDLSYGNQKLVEIARCLLSRPKLILLDEPVAGMNNSERKQISILLRRLKADHRMALLMVEHDVGFVSGIADKVVALDFGHVIASGPTAEVLSSDSVKESYLGGAT
jgi:branched-chain amino acid transport system ATP-binding protein